MRRVVLAAATAAVLLAPAGVRADEGTTSCSPLSCVTVHAHVETGCGADGRDERSCLGTISYEIGFDSPLMVESMEYSVDVTCSMECTNAGLRTSTCGWAPPEVRPLGETGCTVSDVILVHWTAGVVTGCEAYQVTVALRARTVLDPIPAADQAVADNVVFCA